MNLAGLQGTQALGARNKPTGRAGATDQNRSTERTAFDPAFYTVPGDPCMRSADPGAGWRAMAARAATIDNDLQADALH